MRVFPLARLAAQPLTSRVNPRLGTPRGSTRPPRIAGREKAWLAAEKCEVDVDKGGGASLGAPTSAQ